MLYSISIIKGGILVYKLAVSVFRKIRSGIMDNRLIKKNRK